jgi:predicted RND superfamily exporter protein
MIVMLGSHLLQIEINTATEGYLDKDHTELVDFKKFIDQFGRGMQDLCVAVEAPDIFDLKFLNKLKSLHNEIEEKVPLVENTISLINAREIRSESGSLVVGKIFEEWPQTHEELMQLKAFAYKNPLYLNTLFTEDGKFATILIETQGLKNSKDTDEADIFQSFEIDQAPLSKEPEKISEKQFTTSSDTSKIVTSVYEITKKYDAPDFKIYISGSRAVNHYVSTALMHDMNLFFGLSIFIVIIILSFMFKRATGVIFPLMVATLSLLSTFGLMVYFKEPLTLPSQILPAFLIAVGVGYVIHILAIFYRHYDEKGNKEEAVAFAYSHSGLAIILTAATTALGLLSFITADLAPVKGFGIFASAGVIFALIYTMILRKSSLQKAYLKKR